jgi:hypothetical protein
MNQARHADSGLPRLGAQTLIDVSRQRLLRFVDAAPVALHFLQPNGRVGSSMSASCSRKNASCSCSLTPSRVCAT